MGKESLFDLVFSTNVHFLFDYCFTPLSGGNNCIKKVGHQRSMNMSSKSLMETLFNPKCVSPQAIVCPSKDKIYFRTVIKGKKVVIQSFTSHRFGSYLQDKNKHLLDIISLITHGFQYVNFPA